MVKKVVRDPLFLAQKSEPATEDDKQVSAKKELTRTNLAIIEWLSKKYNIDYGSFT